MVARDVDCAGRSGCLRGRFVSRYLGRVRFGNTENGPKRLEPATHVRIGVVSLWPENLLHRPAAYLYGKYLFRCILDRLRGFCSADLLSLLRLFVHPDGEGLLAEYGVLMAAGKCTGIGGGVYQRKLRV